MKKLLLLTLLSMTFVAKSNAATPWLGLELLNYELVKYDDRGRNVRAVFRNISYNGLRLSYAWNLENEAARNLCMHLLAVEQNYSHGSYTWVKRAEILRTANRKVRRAYQYVGGDWDKRKNEYPIKRIRCVGR